MSNRKIQLDPPTVTCKVKCECGAEFIHILYMDIHDKINVRCNCGRAYETKVIQLQGSQNE